MGILLCAVLTNYSVAAFVFHLCFICTYQTMHFHLVSVATCLLGAEASGKDESDISLQGKLHHGRQEAAVQEKAAAMHVHTFLQENDSR